MLSPIVCEYEQCNETATALSTIRGGIHITCQVHIEPTSIIILHIDNTLTYCRDCSDDVRNSNHFCKYCGYIFCNKCIESHISSSSSSSSGDIQYTSELSYSSCEDNNSQPYYEEAFGVLDFLHTISFYVNMREHIAPICDISPIFQSEYENINIYINTLSRYYITYRMIVSRKMRQHYRRLCLLRPHLQPFTPYSVMLIDWDSSQYNFNKTLKSFIDILLKQNRCEVIGTIVSYNIINRLSLAEYIAEHITELLS
jgi:hypothetical protein